MEFINEEILKKYQQMCKQADELTKNKNPLEAIEKFKQALFLLPDGNWQCQAYAYAGIGENYLAMENYEKALKAFYQCYTEETLDNPYVLLNMGICFYELGELQKARNFLISAYMVEGEDIFLEENEKYFAVIQDLIG